MKVDIEKIQRLRQKFGFTLVELAKRSGISVSLLSRIEMVGRTREDTLKKIADVFKVNPLGLIDEEFDKTTFAPKPHSGKLVVDGDAQASFEHIKEALDYSGVAEMFEKNISLGASGIILIDLSGKIGYIPNCLARCFGYNDMTDVIGKNTLELFNQVQVLEIRKELAVQGCWHGTIDCVRKDGSTFQGFVSAFVLINSFQNPVGRIAIFRKAENAKLDDQKWANRKNG
jgi:transcriptional regulator with XRE-family HTH domain